MNQTIQLTSDTGAVLNILLKDGKLCIMGTWYALNHTDAMRLLMSCENFIKRSERYHDFGETGVYLYPFED